METNDTLDNLLREALSEQKTLEVSFAVRCCTKCGITKGYEEFSFCSQTRSDLKKNVRRKKAQCKSCDSKETLAYRQRDIETARRNEREGHYRRKYGIENDLAKILAQATNRIGQCPLCHKIDTLVLDHCHNTQKTRALICGSCNSMLGYAQDNIDVLYEAVAYLKKHRGV